MLEITLNGQVYAAQKPKVRIYKKLMKLQVELPDAAAWSSPDGIEKIIGLLVDVMGNPEITAERIENEMDADQLVPTLNGLIGWINGTFRAADLGEQKQTVQS